MHMTGSGRDHVRLMKQILEDGALDKVKAGQQLAGNCRSWLGARMRFKDVSTIELEPLFQKQFQKAIASAMKFWKDRAAKLLYTCDNKILKVLLTIPPHAVFLYGVMIFKTRNKNF